MPNDEGVLNHLAGIIERQEVQEGLLCTIAEMLTKLTKLVDIAESIYSEAGTATERLTDIETSTRTLR
jgi:hypothetical protein